MRYRSFPAVVAVWVASAPCAAWAAEPAGVAIRVNRESRAVADITLRAGGELVGVYNVGPMVAKPYIWPLNGPGGVPLTRAWPMKKSETGETTDHVHQKSVWFCHGDVIPEGLTVNQKIKGVEGVDFWSEHPQLHGRIVCTSVGEPIVTENHGQIATTNEWRTADGEKVLDESRTIHLYNFVNTRLIVFDIDLNASVVPLTFGDTKEGSFGIRINDSITEAKGKGQLENAEGNIGEKKCWGHLSAWCDYSGAIQGKHVGLAILSDPANPFPACWHSRGYGLMAANPFGREKAGFPVMKGKTDLVKLAKGEHLKLRYGLLLHPGDAKEGKVAEYFDRFVKLKG